MNSRDAEGVAPPPSRPLASWYAQGLSDGLGDRLLMFDSTEAPSLELLRFRAALAQAPAFEAALRDQVRRLDRFRHPAFARVRSVDRLEPDDDLALISNGTPGKRLSDVLHKTQGPAFAAAVIEQLAPALALFQQHAPGVSHGILNADRIVVTPEGRLTIVEHVVGPAVDSLDLQPAQLAAIGITLPPAAGDGAGRLDVATDWYQLGLVAVSVLLGRPVTSGDLPRLELLLDGLANSARADGGGLSPFVRQWLDRALQISGGRIASSADAQAALDEMRRKQQPRDARRVEPVRPEDKLAITPAALLRPAPPAPPAPFAPFAVEPTPVAVASAAVEPSVATPRPIQAGAAVDTVPVGFSGHEIPGRVERLSAFERGVPLASPAARVEPRPRTIGRIPVSTAVIAALALIAIVEAGVIAKLSRALASVPQSPIAVETAAGGENVLVSSGSTEVAPLHVTVAPDLRWVRLVSPPSAGVLGRKATDPAAAATIRISSPIELKVFEQSRLLGSVPGAGVKLAPGRHDIELVNVALGYRARQVLELGAGETVSIHVAPPPGWVTIDASPWADVTIDGQAAGRTPLGPLPLAPGEHQVAFRHPSGGTDRQRVTVKSTASSRVVGILRP